MIATATSCMSLPLALVTGGDDSLDNDFVCDIAVPTSHGYTRAVWFEREAPSSLQLPAKFDSLFHENTRDGSGLCSTMVIVPGWSCSLVPVWICRTVSLRCAAGAYMLCCAFRLCLMHPRSWSFSQQCCGQDGVDIFLVNGAILHAGYFFPEAVGLLVFARYCGFLAQYFVRLCWNGKKSTSHPGAWKKGKGNEDTSQSYSCAAAAIAQFGFLGLLSGAFLSVVMLVGAMLQTAAACRAAATGRFLFSSSDFFLLFDGYGILEAAWLCVCFVLWSEGNKALQLRDSALFAQFGVLGVLSSVQLGMREFPVDTVVAVVDGAVVARQAALRGESENAVAEFVEVRQRAAAARGCHIAFWAKATPRVDVGDTPREG